MVYLPHNLSHIKVNSNLINLMDMDNYIKKISHIIKENLKIIRNIIKEYKFLLKKIKLISIKLISI